MKRVLAGSLVVMMVVLGGWWMSQAPAVVEPVPVPAPAPTKKTVPKKPTIKALPVDLQDPFGNAKSPPKEVVPDAVIDEAFQALANTADGFVVRCTVPDDVTARLAGFFEETWMGSTVTGIVPGPAGSVRLDDSKSPPGSKVAGRLVWENAVKGATSPCTFVPAEPTSFQVTVEGLDGEPLVDGQLSVCNGADIVPLDPSGSTRVSLNEGEVCTIVVETKNDSGSYERTLTTIGYRAFVAAGQDLALTLLDPDVDEERRKAAFAEGGNLARAAMFRPGAIQVDKAKALDADLSSDARAFLEGRR